MKIDFWIANHRPDHRVAHATDGQWCALVRTDMGPWLKLLVEDEMPQVVDTHLPGTMFGTFLECVTVCDRYREMAEAMGEG